MSNKKKAKRTATRAVSSRAREKTKKKTRGKAGKTKVGRHAKNKKISGATRRATHSTRRKPETNNDLEIRAAFSTDIRVCTPEEIAQLKLAFCRAYAKRGIISDGVTAAGVCRDTITKWRKNDEKFNQNCAEAEKMAVDLLEREAYRRGAEGFDRPIIFKGQITGQYTDYSDTLMSMLMKGNKPSKYKERTEHSTPLGRPMELDIETKVDVIGDILGLIESKDDPE